MLKNRILQALCYFDIFRHPLTEEELVNLCSDSSSASTLGITLKELLLEKKCYSQDEYYSIQENLGPLIQLRREKEQLAKKYFSKLPFYSKIIRSFPYVKGIAISGSLSKNVMHDDGDIDYFIITSKDRLWICRTLLVLFKKTFLLNSRKYFCLNYFVDENNLEILDKNIFTAVEVSFLSPVYNQRLIDQLKKKNDWTRMYFPDFVHPLNTGIPEKKSRINKLIEFLFRGKFGDYIDLQLMKLTYNRWRKKFKHFDQDKLELTMRSNRGISKHHPQDFQNKVLKEFSMRWQKLNDEGFARAV